MASYSDKVAWWADWRCDPSKMTGVVFPGWSTPLPVADAAAPAFEVFADLMRSHGYNFRELAGGTYNCRKIAGTNSWSLHAYGIALDLNPSRNPYGTHTHDYPQGFIDDVLATGWFKWGIDFDDPMHWEIDVPPDQIGDDMPTAREIWDATPKADSPEAAGQVLLEARWHAAQARAISRSILKAVNSLDEIDSQALAADIATQLGDVSGFDSDAAAQAFIDKLVAELTD